MMKICAALLALCVVHLNLWGASAFTLPAPKAQPLSKASPSQSTTEPSSTALNYGRYGYGHDYAILPRSRAQGGNTAWDYQYNPIGGRDPYFNNYNRGFDYGSRYSASPYYNRGWEMGGYGRGYGGYGGGYGYGRGYGGYGGYGGGYYGGGYGGYGGGYSPYLAGGMRGWSSPYNDYRGGWNSPDYFGGRRPYSNYYRPRQFGYL